MSGAGTKLCRLCGNGDLMCECAQPFDLTNKNTRDDLKFRGGEQVVIVVSAQPFDPSNVERWNVFSRSRPVELESVVASESFDALALRHTNLQHFMRRMAELHGFEMEETK